jgi:diguanylate cyclase (GGDEF)-like protein/PAS domain S-box-containing protein
MATKPSSSDMLLEQSTPISCIATRDVVTLAADATLREATAAMATQKISSILVTDGKQHPLGIVTEQNVLHAMRIGRTLDTELSLVMSAPIISVPESTSCQEAYLLCLSKGIRHLALLDDSDELSGVVSETDFRLHVNLTTLAGRRSVAAVMTRTVLSLPPDASLQQAVELMEEHQDNSVVVAEEQCPIGIVTERDLVRLFSDSDDGVVPRLEEVMASPVQTVSTETTVTEAAELMLETGMRHLVVVTSSGELAGLVSEHDLTQIMMLGSLDAQLESERAFLRGLVDGIPDLVWLKDPDGVYLACNPRFERFFGASEKEIIGKTDHDFVDKELADFFRANDLKALERGKPTINEEWITFADDGHEELLQTIKTPMRDTQGRVIGVLGIGRDITQARQDQEALKNSEEKLRTLIDAIPDSVQFKDTEGRWLTCNQTAADAFGLTKEQCLGKSDLELAEIADGKYSEALRQCHLTDLKALHTGGVTNIKEEIPQKDGSSVHFEIAKVPISDSEGIPKGLVILARDVSESRRITQALEESLLEFNDLVTRIPVGVFKFRTLKQGGYRFDYVSPRWCEMMGISQEEIFRNARVAFESTHPDDQEGFQKLLVQARRARTSFTWEGRLLLQNGTRWMHIAATPTPLENGDIRWDGIQYDITQRKEAEEKVRLAANVFTDTHEGIVITDPDARIVEVNASFCRITGYDREEVLGENPSLLKSGHQDRTFYKNMWLTLIKDGYWSGEVWNRRKDGEVYAEHLAISTVYDDKGRVSHYVGVFADITPQKEHEKQLERIAHYDALTSVPNRVLLAERMKWATAQTQRDGTSMAVCYLDLDGFKPINDQYGHEAGDLLLIEISRRIKNCLRANDTIARIGGDEFVLLLLGLKRVEECELALRRLLDVIARPWPIGDRQVTLSASIGATLFPTDDSDADALLRHADQAMYKAKEAGRNCYHLFDAEHDRQVKAHKEQQQRLGEALEDGEFRLHYQPKVNMVNGNVLGVEALIRWQHPEDGLLRPADFLSYIQNSDLEVALGEWVLNSALKQLEAWQEQGIELEVSVNIGAEHLLQEDFAERLEAILQRHPNINPAHLELEILESTAITDINQASKTLIACRKLGVRFALDDFGTGYSSLTYFRQLPVETLKIDQSFVMGMLEDPDDMGIVESVVQLTQAFNRTVVAEGAETYEHCAMLSRMRCQAAQGYGIARPMPPENLQGWMQEWSDQETWLSFAKEPPPLQRAELVLEQAMGSHRTWIDNLVAHLQDVENHNEPVLDPDQCLFGMWYHHTGSFRYGHMPEFVAIDPIHEQVHDLAKELCSLARRGPSQRDEVERRIPELFELRDRLTAAMQTLIEAMKDV